ncbi:LOW QUALITY PROTEIN: hypothetical protein TorRG33x02_025470, partial [Trema orientale]
LHLLLYQGLCLNKVRALDPCYHSLETAEIFEQSLISLVSAKNTLDLILKLDVKKKKKGRI